MMKPLTCVINRRTIMTDGSCQRYPESRTAQPGSHSAARTRATARGRRTSRRSLFHLQAPGLSLSPAGAATETAGSGRRCQSLLHNQTLPQPGGETPDVRNLDGIDLERDRQPGIAGCIASRGRTWLTGRRVGNGRCGWNINWIGCWRRSWHTLMNCSCPTRSGPPPEPGVVIPPANRSF